MKLENNILTELGVNLEEFELTIMNQSEEIYCIVTGSVVIERLGSSPTSVRLEPKSIVPVNHPPHGCVSLFYEALNTIEVRTSLTNLINIYLSKKDFV